MLAKIRILTLIGIVALGLGAPQIVGATVLDLTTTTTSGVINGATFTWDQEQPTGTGVLNSFVRIQRNNTEQGYNTTVANAGELPFQETFGIFTHDVLFSSLEAIAGYYQFVLDIGEPANGTQSLLSLDGLKIYVSNQGGQNSDSVDTTTGDANGIIGTVLYNMDATEDSYVLLDANRNGKPGNGVSDMVLSIPESVFAGVLDTQYIILWSRFGLQEKSNSGAESFGTFEEWAYLTAEDGGGGGGGGGGEPVPEPSTFILLGVGLLGLGFVSRKKK